MDWVGIVSVTGGLLIVLIPVAGLTARFALKPLIESITGVMRARQGGGDVTALEGRIAALEAEVSSLRGEITSGEEARAFDRRLAAGEAPRS